MFVHLHCYSHYSFLRGVASPEEIIAAAIEQNMPAVALTDTNGMYAAVPFYFGGTSLLIVVSVTMDTVAQVQGYLLAHQYEGLIKRSKLRGRRR